MDSSYEVWHPETIGMAVWVGVCFLIGLALATLMSIIDSLGSDKSALEKFTGWLLWLIGVTLIVWIAGTGLYYGAGLAEDLRDWLNLD